VSSLTAGLLLLGTLAASAHSPAPGAGPAGPARLRRGPLESRDEFLLAQARLTLPAAAPDARPRGHTRVRVAGDWGNDFGLELGRVNGENRVLFLLDGEHRSLSFEVDHGLDGRWTLHARIPVFWRGGGVLDGLIDTWHRITGLPDNDRPRFDRNELAFVALDAEGQRVPWTAPAGSGLGGLELGARWSSRPREAAWTGGLDARVQLPTGTGGFAGGGVQMGAHLLAARTLGGAADVYAGVGGTVASETEQYGIEYASARPEGFLALEWRPWRVVSLVAQVNAAGRLVENVDDFPGLHVALKMGARIDVGRGWVLEGGFTEGLTDIDATTDFGILLGVERTF
jgi:hypothetical protein